MSAEKQHSDLTEEGTKSPKTAGKSGNQNNEGADNSTIQKAEEEDKSTNQNAGGGDKPSSDSSTEKTKTEEDEMSLFDAFAISLGLKDEPKIESLLDTVDFNGVIKYIKDSKATNIITMAGAGISTSAGIPDFRSPGTGLYDNLQKYNLPHPTAVFSIDYFKENPEPFFMLSRELWPGTFKPTLCHYFVRLLQDKGLLLRHYTQNIDTLETVAGLDPEMIVEAHGHFRTGHCLECGAEYSQDWMKERIMKPSVPMCSEEKCDGVVKPDIVFFGEALPQRFGNLVAQDFPKCDLLIIMGTSLVVQPFASLANRTKQQIPRLYINLENNCPPKLDPIMAKIFGNGFDFEGENNYRDIFWQGTCDAGCEAIADALGWGDELWNLVKTEHAKIDAADAKEKTKSLTTEASKSKTTVETKVKKSGSTPKKSDSTPQKSESTSKNKDVTPKKDDKSAKAETTKPRSDSKTPAKNTKTETTPTSKNKNGSPSKSTL